MKYQFVERSFNQVLSLGSSNYKTFSSSDAHDIYLSIESIQFEIRIMINRDELGFQQFNPALSIAAYEYFRQNPHLLSKDTLRDFAKDWHYKMNAAERIDPNKGFFNVKYNLNDYQKQEPKEFR